MLACLKAFFVSRFFLVSVVVDSFLLRICGFESLRNSVCGLLFPGAGLLHSGCVVSPLFFLLPLVCALLSYNRDRFLSCWDAFFGVLLRFSLYIVRRPSWYLSPSGVLRPRGARCFRSLLPRGAASLRSLVLRLSSNPGFCFLFCLYFRLRRPVLASCYPRNSARQTKRLLLLRLPRSFLGDLACKTCSTSRASTLWRWKCQVATGHLSTIRCTGLELRPRNLKNLSTAGMTILASSTICIFRSPKHYRSTHPSRFFSP